VFVPKILTIKIAPVSNVCFPHNFLLVIVRLMEIWKLILWQSDRLYRPNKVNRTLFGGFGGHGRFVSPAHF